MFSFFTVLSSDLSLLPSSIGRSHSCPNPETTPQKLQVHKCHSVSGRVTSLSRICEAELEGNCLVLVKSPALYYIPGETMLTINRGLGTHSTPSPTLSLFDISSNIIDSFLRCLRNVVIERPLGVGGEALEW
jgi:hypothetical protein